MPQAICPIAACPQRLQRSHQGCLLSAGHLYQPGDYAEAIALTRSLVTDTAARQAMAAAGRAEVERHSWRAAISRVRDEHYQRAIQIYQAHQR